MQILRHLKRLLSFQFDGEATNPKANSSNHVADFADLPNDRSDHQYRNAIEIADYCNKQPEQSRSASCTFEMLSLLWL
jgi:hypothetical protein